MTGDEKFLRIMSKFDRAKKHVEDFYSAARKFGRENPHRVLSRTDVEAGVVAYYIAEMPSIPDELSLIAGDALHNFRSVLDHLAFELFLVSNGDPNETHTYFPILDDFKDYQDSIFTRKVKGMTEPIVEAIKGIQAYKDGDITLWRLHKLDICDKHRLLLTTCFGNFGRTLTPSEQRVYEAYKREHPEVEVIPTRFVNSDLQFKTSLKVGDELLRLPIPPTDANMGFVIDLAFNEPGVAEGIPAGFLFGLIDASVTSAIARLLPFLS
jgi:hypothetical protein